MPGRRWSEGLHQAIEAKEGVQVQRETVTLATITFQNYFRLYDKLAGMTGTAMTEAEEFHKIYKLEVVAIPTHRPMIRDDDADLVFRNEGASSTPSSTRSTRCRRPAGRSSSARSASRSPRSSRRCSSGAASSTRSLNAKFHEKEAGIVAQAGRTGAVTIATNMAGRGTDILLGGNPAGLASELLHKRGPEPGRGRQGRRTTRRSPRRRRSPTRTTSRSSPPAGSTSSAPSATRAAASTTSSAAAPAARATRARRASTCRSRTT